MSISSIRTRLSSFINGTQPDAIPPIPKLMLRNIPARAVAALSPLLIVSAAMSQAPTGLPMTRQVTIPVLVAITPKGEKIASDGAILPVRLTLEDNTRRIPTVIVKIGNDDANAQSTWNASAFMAAFAAARETKHRMIEYSYFADAPPGNIDGPSAGMFFSAAYLALINGAEIKSDRAMTGTVNPDGTVGPVGGIPHKLLAAKKGGITKFGYPVGQKLEFSQQEQKYVDIAFRCRQLGIEPVELRDINDAYYLLTDQKTGNEIASIAPLPPNLPQPVADKVRAAFMRSRQACESKYQQVVELYNNSGKLPELRDADIRATMGYAEEFYDTATLSFKAGSIPAAYMQTLSSLAMCEAAETEIKAVRETTGKAPLKTKLNASVNVLVNIQKTVQQAREALELTIQANLTAQALVPRVESLSAYINLREGFSLELAGDSLVNEAIIQAQNVASKSGAMPAGYLECISKACLYYAQAKTRYQTSQDYYSTLSPRAASEDVVLNLTPEFEQSIGDAYTMGARSSLTFLDAVTRERWKQEVKQQLEAKQIAGGFQADFADKSESVSLVDGSYLPNRIAANYDQNAITEKSALEGLTGARAVFQTDTSSNLASFGSGAASYLGLSALVLQYYNYGSPQMMTYSRSFGTFIDLARTKALDSARKVEEAMAKEIGATPVPRTDSLLPAAILLNLELADCLRYGSYSDKLQSMKVYWRVSILCDLSMDMIRQSKG